MVVNLFLIFFYYFFYSWTPKNVEWRHDPPLERSLSIAVVLDPTLGSGGDRMRHCNPAMLCLLALGCCCCCCCSRGTEMTWLAYTLLIPTVCRLDHHPVLTFLMIQEIKVSSFTTKIVVLCLYSFGLLFSSPLFLCIAISCFIPAVDKEHEPETAGTILEREHWPVRRENFLLLNLKPIYFYFRKCFKRCKEGSFCFNFKFNSYFVLIMKLLENSFHFPEKKKFKISQYARHCIHSQQRSVGIPDIIVWTPEGLVCGLNALLQFLLSSYSLFFV